MNYENCIKSINNGNSCLKNNDFSNALYHFDIASKKCKNYIDLINKINETRIRLLERLNELNEAYLISERFKYENHLGIQKSRLLILKRLHKNNEAIKLCHQLLNRKDIDDESISEIYFYLGDIYNNKENIHKCFKCYFIANNYVRKLRKNSDKTKYYPLSFIDLMSNNFKELNSYTSGLNDSPIFLVGFPRSGTTLLNTILNCHRSIETIEEKPTFHVNYRYLIDNPEESISFLNSISNSYLKGLSDDYYSNVGKYADINKKIIDKFPLRFIDIGIINKVFPNAKYVFMIRHPLDCILSCFMQNFEINDSMSNFFTIKESGDFYNKSLNLWKDYVENLNLNVYYIYYENLINNFEYELKNLNEFLNVDFDENMLNYFNNKCNISTPSYNQVSKKLYTSAMYRWEKYNSYLERVKTKMDKWIEYFGYRK